MITSEDVRHVMFDRVMRGYRCEDVDDYLKQVADSMDALAAVAAERDELQKKLVVLAQRIDQYRADEDTLRTTMINAQRLGENVIKEAKQKAAEIIRAANIKAEDREQHARDEVELAQQELITIRHEADAFKKSLMEMYRKHIELLTKLPSYQEDVEPPPEPAAPPVPQEPAPVPEVPEPAAPLAEEYEQQQFEEPEEDYPEPDAAEEEDPEDKIDTVEFAIADADQPPAPPEEDGTRYVPGAGLYDAPERPSRRAAKPRAAKAQEDLPEGLESFAGVDFDS